MNPLLFREPCTLWSNRIGHKICAWILNVPLIQDIFRSDNYFVSFSIVYFEIGAEIRVVLHFMYSLLTSNLKEPGGRLTALPNVKFCSSLLNSSQIVSYEKRTERSTLMCVEGQDRSIFTYIKRTGRSTLIWQKRTDVSVLMCSLRRFDRERTQNTEYLTILIFLTLKYLFCKTL